MYLTSYNILVLIIFPRFNAAYFGTTAFLDVQGKSNWFFNILGGGGGGGRENIFDKVQN